MHQTHPATHQRVERPCRWFAHSGTCRNGNDCKFDHVQAAPLSSGDKQSLCKPKERQWRVSESLQQVCLDGTLASVLLLLFDRCRSASSIDLGRARAL